MSANTSQEINVRVTDASVRECVMYANLHGRGEDTNQIGTALSVQISSAFDAWILAHDAELTEKVRAEMQPLVDALRAISTHRDEWTAAIELRERVHGGGLGEQDAYAILEEIDNALLYEATSGRIVPVLDIVTPPTERKD